MILKKLKNCFYVVLDLILTECDHMTITEESAVVLIKETMDAHSEYHSNNVIFMRTNKPVFNLQSVSCISFSKRPCHVSNLNGNSFRGDQYVVISLEMCLPFFFLYHRSPCTVQKHLTVHT